MPDHAAPGARIAALWTRLSPLPGGTWLFGRVLGRMVPYTDSIGAHIREDQAAGRTMAADCPAPGRLMHKSANDGGRGHP